MVHPTLFFLFYIFVFDLELSAIEGVVLRGPEYF